MELIAILAATLLLMCCTEADPVTQCPTQPNIPHGSNTCTDGNNTGSVCSYQCEGLPYSIYPEGRNRSTCQANGTWSQELPCCARPCPPYMVFDWVNLLHFTDGPMKMNILESLMNNVIAEDAVQYGMLYYNEKPVMSTVIGFGDYEHNLTEYFLLVRQKLVQFSKPYKGPSNAGAAVKYATENMFKEDKGARDEAPKVICIVTDNYADDDVINATEKARQEGFLVYFYAFNRPGLTFDRNELEKITGDKDHVFIFDKDVTLSTKYLEAMMSHFCNDPCDHVVHEHDHDDDDHDDDDHDDDDHDDDDHDDDDQDDDDHDS